MVACVRCQGQYVPYTMFDGALRVNGWRCINCGSVIDHLIFRHQQQQRQGIQPVKHGKYMNRAHGGKRRA